MVTCERPAAAVGCSITQNPVERGPSRCCAAVALHQASFSSGQPISNTARVKLPTARFIGMPTRRNSAKV